MTMAIGFLCTDGVVIGADRQITGANYTFPDCKILGFNWENGAGAWAFSGNFDLQKEFAHEVYSVFKFGETIQEEEVPKKWRECLDAVQFSQDDPLLTIFGFLTSAGVPRLFMSNREKRVLPVGRAEVIGYGDSPLARSLLGGYYDVSFAPTAEQAHYYAIEFISQAKKYDGQYVGGGTDVFAVKRSPLPSGSLVTVLDAGRTAEWEQRIELARYWMNIFFNEMIDVNGNMTNIARFQTRMEEFRKWVGGSPIPWPKPSDSQKSGDRQ